MTKYKLSIKYPVPEKYKDELKALLHFDGSKVELANYKLSAHVAYSDYACIVSKTNVHEVQNCPREWLEKINESAFEKWVNDNFTDKGKDAYVAHMPTLKCCWQASQENRDLLYKELIDFIDSHTMHKQSCRFIADELEKLVKKIKEQL